MPKTATAAGTQRLRERLGAAIDPAHFRDGLGGLSLSSLGAGTYLGDPNDQGDAAYGEALVTALTLGANVVDTAINYRAQRSERVVGLALRSLTAAGAVQRDEIVVCTKGGYLPFDGGYPRDPARYFQDTYVRSGLLAPEDLVEGSHALAPRFVLDQLGRSLRNLQLDAVDVYYLHNPETQLGTVERDEFHARMGRAFAVLERAAGEGRIGAYGIATWNGLRVPPTKREHLSLADLVTLAEREGGKDHHFRAVQLPVNLGMPEAFGEATQRLGDRSVSLLEAADHFGITVFASAPLIQGRLIGRLPEVLATAMTGCTSDAQRALQFVRSTPGVTTALVGMRQRVHAEENLALARLPPASEDAYLSLFTSRS